ncbi:nuclear transport factor 2 family protein [Pacificispira sp.]|uniref:nuclear transport factor 2 family protein n=1 Tax=Pacificispira sp. TaxID=2888761 RepID=UPI002EA847F5|nr:nuclear transport factor 2 family protein [Pseudomonadota bacterium]
MTDRETQVRALYHTVDRRDAPALAEFLTETVRFQLGNYDPIIGREAVIDANAGFFGTIQDMRHSLNGIWSVEETTICNGDVHYVRNDGSTLTLPFATVLTFEDGRIADYQVYVNVSPL